jgi:gamma-glutamyltranspeptidase/glutathione hydrolase
MALQFQHVFAGKGIGPGEVECDALIDLLTVAVMEGAVVGIAAGARLPSNMTPAVARRSRSVLAIGSPGADRITTALHQFMVHFIQRGLTLSEAIAHPRLHLEFGQAGMKVAFEPGLEPGDCDLPVTLYPEISMYFGGVAAALFDGECGFDVAADPRREGATFVSPEHKRG